MTIEHHFENPFQQGNPNSVFNYYKWLINDVRLNDEFTRQVSSNRKANPSNPFDNWTCLLLDSSS